MKHFFLSAAIAGVMTVSATQDAAAQDRRVRIINNTGYDIVRFYGSNKGSKSWEEDILGNSILPSGSSVNVNFDDGTGYCKFDLKAVFEDGDVLVKNNVNICEIGSFTYN
jgi:hypothetical protein